MEIDSEGKVKLALLLAFGILLFAIWSNVAAYAQSISGINVN
jgi:hypothetical protein